MKQIIAFYDTKPYDRISFDAQNNDCYEIKYFESKLIRDTAMLARGASAACAFVNDVIDAATINALADAGVRVLAMRCAGFNNVDFRAAHERKLAVVRVPAYSPYAVAEHAIGMLLTLDRKLHKAYNRTRDYNFSLNGLTGFDLHGKTIGIVGTGRIGRILAGICNGFGMKVIGFDAFPVHDAGIEYVTLDELARNSDIISFHCPLTPETHHVADAAFFAKTKRGAFIINTSRGALIDSLALLDALRSGQIGAAALDVYEEESEWFFEDRSNDTRQNETLSLLVSLPNVLVTSHQAFLTREALANIAETTLSNINAFFSGAPLVNEICYQCTGGANNPSTCSTRKNGRCF